jgi:TonB family protein
VARVKAQRRTIETRTAWIFFLIALSAVLSRAVTAEEKTTTPALTSNTEDADKVLPFAIYMVNPEFPEFHNKKSQQGQIVLRATIATDGTVKDVSIVAGEPSLADLVAAAVRKWRYVPAMRAGQFIESAKEISIAYRVGGDLSSPGEPVSTVARAPKEDLMAEVASGNLYHGKQNGTVPPKALQAPDPDYPEAARIDKFQGTLLLGVVVGTDGKPRDIWVVRPLGHGIDEKAIDAVKTWTFAPATRNGNAVSALINVEVSFRASAGNAPQFEYAAPQSEHDGRQLILGDRFGPAIAPLPIHTPSPRYSKEARKNHIVGTVVLSLTIGTDGKPTNIQVAKSLGFGLDENAVDAVRHWRWDPAKINGQPIPVPERVSLDFKLP